MTSPNVLPSDSEVLRQMNQMNEKFNNLATLVGSLVEKQNTPAPPQELSPEELRDRPDLMLAKLKEHIDNSIRPINEFREDAQRQANYLRNKETVRRSDPRFEKLWDKIEGSLDSTITQSRVDPNVQIIHYHVSALIGQYLMANPTALSAETMHIPPSPPAPSSEVPKDKARELTENEKVIAKMRGWTAEEFLKKSDGDEAVVVSRSEAK